MIGFTKIYYDLLGFTRICRAPIGPIPGPGPGSAPGPATIEGAAGTSLPRFGSAQLGSSLDVALEGAVRGCVRRCCSTMCPGFSVRFGSATRPKILFEDASRFHFSPFHFALLSSHRAWNAQVQLSNHCAVCSHCALQHDAA